MAEARPYLFYDSAVSVCAVCLRRCEAKILIQDGKVFMDKYCYVHGHSRVLVSDDSDYYRQCREVYIKPPERPLRFNTPTRYGCPYDCGLCPDHMQHSCLALIEITDHCNLKCPICYADSGPHRQGFIPLASVESMLDTLVANEGAPDVVQISGGEPSLHPEIFAILDAAKRRPIRHLMLNTNGLRIAQSPEFAARLAEYQPGFEVYLQFDSLREAPLRALRGAELSSMRRRALDALNRHNTSTTLVVTLRKGLNDDEIGDIIRFALEQPCVRGITFQPIQAAGRLENFDAARDRLTLSEVRRAIIDQSGLFTAADVIPVPCNPDSLAMAYCLKIDGKVVPLTRYVPPETLLSSSRNTIVFERDATLKEQVFSLFSTSHSPESQAESLAALLCCLPGVQFTENICYDNVFRVLIIQFFDAHSFDLRAVKKSCVHIVQPDGRIIPFDTYNLFYRDDLSKKLDALRAEIPVA